MSDVGKRLREERDRKHLTQVEVFTKTGINNKTLSGYENDVSHPDFETLKILAELYGVTTDYLLGVDGKEASIEETEEQRDMNELIQFIRTTKRHENIKVLLDVSKNMKNQ